MAKSILGVVVGYIAMMIFLFAVLTMLYLALGADRVFQHGTFQITPIWIALALATSLVGGALGGYVCHALSGSAGAGRILALIVVVAGIAICLPAMMADSTPRLRRGDMPTMQAMQQGQGPIWMHLLSAALGGAGVILGAGRRRSPAAV